MSKSLLSTESGVDLEALTRAERRRKAEDHAASITSRFGPLRGELETLHTALKSNRRALNRLSMELNDSLNPDSFVFDPDRAGLSDLVVL